MYVCHSCKKLLRCEKKSLELRILNADDQADEVLFGDDGEDTNDEEEFLEESDNELSDEGMSKKIRISSILFI